jgi:transcriptional regulator with XRE-family HTH domain
MKTRDFREVLMRKLLEDPKLAEAVDRERVNAQIATEVYRARTAKGYTQKELAALVDTSQSCIARIEDAEYEGRSLTLLQRIAFALGMKLEVSLCAAPQFPSYSNEIVDEVDPENQWSDPENQWTIVETSGPLLKSGSVVGESAVN